MSEVESFFHSTRYEVLETEKGEDRMWSLGKTSDGRYLAVLYTIRNGHIRLSPSTLQSVRGGISMKKSTAAGKKKAPPLNLPDFKSEAEEAAWWDANADVMFERAKKYGHSAPPLNVVPTVPISIRVDEDILQRAKDIGRKRNQPYQRVLKEAMRAGLKKVASS
jgi:hypothetical protein